MYLNAINLCGWAMSKKLPTNGFKWENDPSRFNENFIKNYNENSDVGYFLQVDIEYPKQLWGIHKDLPFLLERKKLEKVEKLVCSIEVIVCYTCKSFKTSTKSWINIKRCAQSN